MWEIASDDIAAIIGLTLIIIFPSYFCIWQWIKANPDHTRIIDFPSGKPIH